MVQNDGMSPKNTNLDIYALICAGRVVKFGIYQKKLKNAIFGVLNWSESPKSAQNLKFPQLQIVRKL